MVKINLKVCRDTEMNTFNQKLASLEMARVAVNDGNDFEATVTEKYIINGEFEVQSWNDQRNLAREPYAGGAP